MLNIVAKYPQLYETSENSKNFQKKLVLSIKKFVLLNSPNKLIYQLETHLELYPQ